MIQQIKTWWAQRRLRKLLVELNAIPDLEERGRQVVLCALGRHQYEWGGKYLIPAKSIHSWTQLDTKLECHFCHATVGPQPGRSVLEEL